MKTVTISKELLESLCAGLEHIADVEEGKASFAFNHITTPADALRNYAKVLREEGK